MVNEQEESTPILRDPAEANRRYGQVFRTLTQRSVDTTTFRRLAAVGMPYAEAQVHSQNLGFVEELAAGAEFEKFFLDRDAALEFYGGPEGMAEQMTSNQISTYQRSVDAAAVVFAHSWQ